MATNKEIANATWDTLLHFSKPGYRHLVTPEWEESAISLIKCHGNHIGDPEARKILESVRKAIKVVSNACNNQL